MNFFFAKYRWHWSYYIVFIFGILLGLSFILAELFQAPPIELQEIKQLIKNPIPDQSLQKIDRLTLSNKQGTFELINHHPLGGLNGPWTLESPQKARAKNAIITKIVRSLESINIRNILHAEPINLSSFSIDSPTFSMSWSHRDYGQLEIKFGLINPIDNSLYFTLTKEKWIYQSTIPSEALEIIGLNDFIDTEMIFIQQDKLLRIEISRSPFGDPHLSLEKINNRWQKRDGAVVTEDNIVRFFEKFHKIKSYMILDKIRSDDLDSFEKVRQAPNYKLTLIYPDRMENYFISSLQKNIGTINFTKGSSFLFYLQDSPAPLVVAEQYYNFFQTKDSDL